MTTEEIVAELDAISDRIDATFDEGADRHTADRQLALEDVERRVAALRARIGGAR